MEMSDYTDAEDEDAYLKQSVDILPEAIREEFVRVPADLAYWGEKYAEAVKAHLLAAHHTKRMRAQLSIQVRELAHAKDQKLTVDQVEAWVEQAPDYQSMRLQEIEAEAAKVSARCRLDAVSAKKDMVVSLGSHMRAEMSPTQLNTHKR